MLVWAVVLALALYLPVRKLIWVLYVRGAMRRTGAEVGSDEQARLKRRASVTAALLSFVFSVLYAGHLFSR